MGFLKSFAIFLLFLGVLASAVGIYFYNNKEDFRGLKLDSSIEDESSSQHPYAPALAIRPKSEQQIVDAIISTKGPIMVSGVHYSLGGDVTYPGSLYLDMSDFNQVLKLDVENKRITVQAGISWQQIQQQIDQHDLALKIMPDAVDFSVGGSLSVNAHGRFVRQGAIINSVRSIRIILADGKVYEASPEVNPALFYGAIGGFGGVGVITEATLDLTDNIAIERSIRRVNFNEFNDYFQREILKDEDVVLHQAILYPPNFESLLDISWKKSDKPLTDSRRLQDNRPEPWWETLLKVKASAYTLYHRFRKNLFDPLRLQKSSVVKLNLESSYNLRSLGFIESNKTTTVVQEYVIPLQRFEIFTFNMRDIFTRFDVDIDKILVEYVPRNHRGLLSGSASQAYSFKIIYYQRKSREGKQQVAQWTRELVRASRESNGIHILPYAVKDTTEQLFNAYSGAEMFFDLKRKADPDCRFRNLFWDQHLDKIYATKVALKGK
jgi:hypothetical protein